MEWISAKTILSSYTDKTDWFGINYNMNIYKGCPHGCIYCDSRSECYHIDRFDEVRAKEHAMETLEKELKSKRKTGVIGTGSMNDPYSAFEKTYELTRGALKLINRYQFGVAIATKSNLIERDIDLLCEIAKHSPVIVTMTITTFDDELCRKIEPNVSVTSDRLKTIKRLADAGIYVGVLMMPILPYINDTENNILSIVRASKEHGAKFIYPSFGVTLRQNQRDYYYQQLDRLFPGMSQKYRQTFGDQYSCHSPDAKQLAKVFKVACQSEGILYKMNEIIEAYKTKLEPFQLSMF